MHLVAQPPPPLHRQLGRKLQPAGALHHLQRHLKLPQRFVVVNGGVGQHKRSEADVAAGAAVLCEDDLVKVRRHGDVGRAADDLVVHAPLAVRVAAREVQGPRDDAHARVGVREAPAKVLEVRPVVPVEAVADLRAHIAQGKGGVHGGLAPLCVGGGDLVAAVVAAAEVVFEFGAEGLRDRGVFDKGAVAAVGSAVGQGGWGDVFGDPVRVACAAVEGGG